MAGHGVVAFLSFVQNPLIELLSINGSELADRWLERIAGLAPETVENSIQQLNSMSARCNNPEIAGKLQRSAVRCLNTVTIHGRFLRR
jgi:hypothetical protein